MVRLHGGDLAVLWADSQGTLVIPTVRSFVPSIEYEVIDYTTQTDVIRKWRPTRINARSMLTYVDFDGVENGVAGTAVKYRLRKGAVGTLIWGEQGTASGKPKGAYKASIIRNDPTLFYDAEIERVVKFMPREGTLIADPGTAVFL